MLCWSPSAAILTFIVISIIILLIMWFAVPVLSIFTFIWFLFAGIIFSLMLSNGEISCTSYFLVLVFTFPIISIVVGAFAYYALE